MSLAAIDATRRTLTWAGVGNVEGVLVPTVGEEDRAPIALMLRGGVIGAKLPSVHVEEHRLAVLDTLILATDGIRSDFMEGLNANDSPQRIADTILAVYSKPDDDATVLVARYMGPR